MTSHAGARNGCWMTGFPRIASLRKSWPRPHFLHCGRFCNMWCKISNYAILCGKLGSQIRPHSLARQFICIIYILPVVIPEWYVYIFFLQMQKLAEIYFNENLKPNALPVNLLRKCGRSAGWGLTRGWNFFMLACNEKEYTRLIRDSAQFHPLECTICAITEPLQVPGCVVLFGMRFHCSSPHLVRRK